MMDGDESTLRTGIGRLEESSSHHATQLDEDVEDPQANVEEAAGWQAEGTPFKEFARRFRSLMVFRGDLGRMKEAPIDVLSWEL